MIRSLIKGTATMLAAMLSMAVLSACAMSPATAPKSDMFSQMVPIGVEMPMPDQLVDRPNAAVVTVQGRQVFAFDETGAAQLMKRDIAGAANTELAEQCTAGFNSLASSYDNLLNQAQAHEQIYNRLGERWAEAENDLHRTRFDHGIETWANRALTALAIGLAL